MTDLGQKLKDPFLPSMADEEITLQTSDAKHLGTMKVKALCKEVLHKLAGLMDFISAK